MKILNKKYIYPFLIFIGTLIVCLFSIKEGHQWGDDFAQYFAQARAIYNGTTEQFVKDNTFVVLNSPVEMATPVYPWGFPLLLSLFYPLFGENIVLYKIINVVFVSVNSVLLYLLLNKYLKNKELSFVLGASFGVNYYILKFVNNVTSDLLFLVLSLICYILMKDYFKHEYDIRKLILIGFVMGYSYTVRSQGIALILSYLICEVIIFIKDRKLDYRRLLPYIGVISVMMLDKLLLPHSERSSLYFLEYMNIDKFLYNIKYYFLVLEGLMPVPYELQRYLYVVALLIIVAGIVYIFKKKQSVYNYMFIVFSFLFFTGINLLFPWYQGARYMLPCFPLFVLLFGYGMCLLLELINNKKVEYIAELAMLLFLSVYGLHSYTYYNIMDGRYYDKGAYTDEALQMYDFIEKETQEDDVFCFFKPRALYMKTGRLAHNMIELDSKYLEDADYIIECNEDSYIDVSKLKDVNFEIVFSNEKLTVYKIVH